MPSKLIDLAERLIADPHAMNDPDTAAEVAALSDDEREAVVHMVRDALE